MSVAILLVLKGSTRCANTCNSKPATPRAVACLQTVAAYRPALATKSVLNPSVLDDTRIARDIRVAVPQKRTGARTRWPEPTATAAAELGLTLSKR